MGKPDFFTGKDGKVHPITPKKKGAGGAVTLAGVIVGGVIAAGGGVGGGLGSAGAAAESLPGQLRAKTNHSKSAARKGHRDKAWRRLDVRRLKRDTKQALSCAVNSYGQVQSYFLSNPCKALDRTLLILSDGSGNTMLVSVTWVRMRTADGARDLRSLADTNGTGNVEAIGASGLQLGGTRFTGEFYDSDMRGSLAVIAEAASLDGAPDPALLHAATEIAVVLPPP